MTDVLLVAVDRDLADRVAGLRGHRIVTIDRDNKVQARTPNTSAEGFHPDLIFVGTGVATDKALNYARVMVEDYPDIAVFLVADADRELIQTATKAGIRGVIDSRIGDRDLQSLIDRVGHTIQPLLDQSGGPHQVIVVASPKGGVGKTTTSINMAALLAEESPGQVVVIDLDLQFGDVSSMLDLKPAYTVANAFASGGDDSMLLRTMLIPHPSQFFVLCGSDNPAENGRVSGDQIRKLVHQYSSIFRYVIIDTPAGLHEETLASLEEATDVVFVTALDVATLRAVRREIDVLAELCLLPQRRHVVLNRADARSGLRDKDAAKILGLPIDAVIPISDKVQLAANRGELAVHVRRRNPVRRPFLELTRRVADRTNHEGVDLR